MRICSPVLLLELEWFASTIAAGFSSSRFPYNSQSRNEILIMIIGHADAAFIHTAPQNGMGQRGFRWWSHRSPGTEKCGRPGPPGRS